MPLAVPPSSIPGMEAQRGVTMGEVCRCDSAPLLGPRLQAIGPGRSGALRVCGAGESVAHGKGQGPSAPYVRVTRGDTRACPTTRVLGALDTAGLVSPDSGRVAAASGAAAASCVRARLPQVGVHSCSTWRSGSLRFLGGPARLDPCPGLLAEAGPPLGLGCLGRLLDHLHPPRRTCPTRSARTGSLAVATF
jgi:hypothetical protein